MTPRCPGRFLVGEDPERPRLELFCIRDVGHGGAHWMTVDGTHADGTPRPGTAIIEWPVEDIPATSRRAIEGAARAG